MPLGFYRVRRNLDEELLEVMHSAAPDGTVSILSAEIDFSDQSGKLSPPLIERWMKLSHASSYFCSDLHPFLERIKGPAIDPTGELINRIALYLMALNSKFEHSNPNFKFLKEELTGLYGRASQALHRTPHKEALNALLMKADGSSSILFGAGISQEDVRRHFQKRFCCEEYSGSSDESLEFEFPFGVPNDRVFFIISHRKHYVGYDAWLFRNIYKNNETSITLAPYKLEIPEENLSLIQARLLQECPNRSIALVQEKWDARLSPLNKFYLAAKKYAIMRKNEYGAEN